MKFGSLFSGIGGMDLGLERAGMECAWQVEIDEFCRKVLTKHWPNVPKFRDVTKFCRRVYDCEPENEYGEVTCPRCEIEFGECECIGTDQLIDEHGTVDIICGGFPCQDTSNAGFREGIDGERSGLWSEFMRVLCELQPRYAIVENVSGLSVRGLQQVLGDLVEGGFDAEWASLRACELGAVHSRERLFIVAYPISNGLERRHAATVFMQRPASALDNTCNWPALSEPFGIRNLNGIPSGMDRIKSLGNAVVPQVAEWIGRKIIEANQ